MCARRTELEPVTAARDDAAMADANRAFYDPLWAGAKLITPERFNTWPLIQRRAAESPRRLEVGPGLRPRLPIAGTHFADISPPALDRLAEAGAEVRLAPIGDLPYADSSFDLVCALDIIEHVDDDGAALSELNRVAAGGATVLLSVPLHPEYWTPFDDLVGHRRRYEPALLARMLDRYGLAVEQSAAFGMKPKSSKLVDVGMWFLVNTPRQALWWYNNVFMPIGLRFQKPLQLQQGMIPTDGVVEVFLVCRRISSN